MSRGAAVAILLHVAVAAATAVAYALARPPRPARLDGQRGVIAILGGWAYWVTHPMLEGAAALGLSANALTTLGLAVSALAGLAASYGEWGWAGLLLVWGSIGDLLDGQLARRTGTSSPAGAFLDSNLDRISEIAVLAGLAAGFPDRPGVFWAVAALAASLMVSYARARGEGLGVACPSFGVERPHRLVIMMAALLTAAFLAPDDARLVTEAACAIVAVTAAATAAGRIAVIHGILRRAVEPAVGAEGPPAVGAERPPAGTR